MHLLARTPCPPPPPPTPCLPTSSSHAHAAHSQPSYTQWVKDTRHEKRFLDAFLFSCFFFFLRNAAFRSSLIWRLLVDVLCPVFNGVKRQPSETLSEAGGGLNRGKVTREVLDKAFGRSLLKIIEDYKGERLTASSRGSREEKRDEDHSMRNIDVLAGTDTVAGKLQAGGRN